VLDAERGVPLAVKLTGKVGFLRDGKRFAMAVSVDSAVSGIGTASVIVPPGEADVVATPERRREVDDRDYLLQGIAPPLRRNPDGTAVPPQPRLRTGEPAPAVNATDKATKAKSDDKSGKARPNDKASKPSKSGDAKADKPSKGAKP